MTGAVATPDEASLVAAATRGDSDAFAVLVRRYRRELHVHCYRMLGSLTEAEDLVQETLLRGWRRLGTFEGRSSFRSWLYRIATNACLDALDRRPRRVLPRAVAAATPPGATPPNVAYQPLEPYPDELIELAATDAAAGPDAVVIAKETIELAFLAAIQYLPVGQRAVLILRDVLGWPANDTAAALGMTSTAVKSSLQRARSTLKERLGSDGGEWPPPPVPSDVERSLVERYIAAHESDDPRALAAVLREDVRVSYPPHALWRDSRDAFITASAEDAPPGDYRFLTTRANSRPAVVIYHREPSASVFRPVALEVLHIEGDTIVEIVDFDMPHIIEAFGVPAQL